MGETTGISWTEKTWNPWHGCHKISPGCKNCYMFSDKKRYGQDPNIVVRSKTTFRDPLRWKDPALVFTCSWSDWFIEEADAWRPEAYDIIERTPHLTYQILTKRIERLFMELDGINGKVRDNVWLGVSVEDRAYGLPRIDILRLIPAALRFLSIEPLLEDLGRINLEGIDWVILGGESGAGARILNVDWVSRLIDQCRVDGVKCFVKQFGSRPGYQRVDGWRDLNLRDHKGGNIAEWPAEYRVREMPVTPQPQLVQLG